MTPAPDGETVLHAYDETRKFLGFDDDTAPVPCDELVEQLVAEGYDRGAARDAVSLTIERGDLVCVEEIVATIRNDEVVHVDGGVRPPRDGTESRGSDTFATTKTEGQDAENSDIEPRPSGSEASNPRVDETQDAAQGSVDEERVLEAFEACVAYYQEHLDDELPEETSVEADTAREYFEDVRGWERETVEKKRLGYAPVGHGHELLDRLMSEGYTREEILGTGLFYENLTPHFEGRVVFPYFDGDGRPCYAISRTTGHPDDPKANQKYTKAVKTKDYSHVDEPIYGLDTVDEDTETVLVAEGMPDAITAHELGYAAVSPVTTQFKRKHHDVVLDAAEDLGARVVVVADNDPVDSDLDEEGCLEVTQYGEGLKGALRTADFLDENGVDARVAVPPTVAHHGNDLDDFVHEGWGTVEHLVAAAKPPSQFDAYEDVRKDREERLDRARETFETNASDTSAVYDLRLSGVLGVSEGFRGKNPLGHRGTRENYFVVIDETVAYDHKRKEAYNPLTALLVEAGVRSVDSPAGRLSDEEHFEAWRHAKEEQYIPDDSKIPRRALRHVADTATKWDGNLVEHEARDGDTFEGLPTEVYNAALDHVEEDLSLETGRRRSSGDDEPERHDVFDACGFEEVGMFDNLTEQKRHLRKRGKLPTNTEVSRRVRGAVTRAMKREKNRVVPAPTAAGKSHTVAAAPWTGYRDVTGGEPVVHLHKTKDARRDAYQTSKEENVAARELVGRKDERRGCPIARGGFDGEVEIEGVAPSVWIDAACEGKGLPFSLVHAEAVRRIEENAPGVLDEHDAPCPDCPPVTQHEGVPRNDDGDPSVDVVHATHQFGHVPSYLVNCNVVVDEQPDFRVELSRDRVRRAVTAFLQEVDAPLDTFERLLVGRNNEHLEVGEEKVVEALEREPSKSWYFENEAAHALAPALARAVWYAHDGGNGRKKARVYHEPPRLDDDRDGGGLGCYVTLILDETPRQDGEEDAVVYAVPNFEQARSVIGLDARPCMDVWALNTVPEIGYEPVLDPEERRNWRFFERGLRVVQVGDATRPVGGNGEYFDKTGERAVLETLVKEYGDDLRALGTAKDVESGVVEILKGVLEKLGYDPELVESLHYGEEKSRNVPAFMDAAVGYVTHCIDPGDDYVLDVIAARGLDARPERAGECPECDGDGCHECDGTGHRRAHGRGFVGDDADKAEEILESVRGNHVAQMIGRYARDPTSDDVSVVFVRTDACPDDLTDAKAKDVVWSYGEKQKAVVDELRETDGGVSARELRENVADRLDDDVTKEHVADTLRRIEAYGDARRDEEEGRHGADIWTWTGDAGGLTETGVVDLSTDETNVGQITNSDVWDNYTWEFVVCVPMPVEGGANPSVAPARSDSGGVDPGLNRTLDAFGAD